MDNQELRLTVNSMVVSPTRRRLTLPVFARSNHASDVGATRQSTHVGQTRAFT